jgi:tagatose 6-phosphate kinase
MIVAVTLAPAIDRTARVERLTFDTILRPDEVRVLPGGKGINAARAARRLGASVATTGICGGHAGRWLVEALEREGLLPRFVQVDVETRTTYVTIDGGGRSTLVYEPAPAVPAAALDELLTTLGAMLKSGDWVCCAGSVPAGLGDDAWARVVDAARRAGAQCLVDTGGAALMAALGARPDIVKVSLDEARQALGPAGHAGAAHLARRLAVAAAGLAVVTDGPRGAAASDGGRAWLVRVPRVNAINPIGGGDAFNAGLIVALAADRAPSEALRDAGAAATASVLELGAGELDPDTMSRLREGVSVREVRDGTL